jgi:hypothetical protein
MSNLSGFMTILHHSIDGIILKHFVIKKAKKMFDKFNTISSKYNLKSVFQYQLLRW